MRNLIVSFLVLLLILSSSQAKTVVYWQLDGAADNKDAMENNWPDNYDLQAFGTLGNGETVAGTGSFTVPNPSIAAWKPEAGDGDATISSNGQSFSGGAGWYTPEIAPELQFDVTKSFTAECWFNLSNTLTQYIMGNRHANSVTDTGSGTVDTAVGWYTGWNLWNTGTGLTLYIRGDSQMPGLAGSPSVDVNITSSVAITANTWYHVAVVWDHDDGTYGKCTLYLDGVEVASASGDVSWNGVSGGNFAVGQRALWVDEDDLGAGIYWGNTGLNGTLDEIRYVDEALVPTQFLNGSVAYSSPEDLPFNELDLDRSGYADLGDLLLMAESWLKCTDPTIAGCGAPIE